MILVVGGAGYIGGSVTDILSNNKQQFRVYDNLLYEESYMKPVQFVYGDVRDQDRLRFNLKLADSVIWLAALVGDGACQVNPAKTYEINTEAVKFLSENFNGRIIFTSTCSVYGINQDILTEESPVHPLSVYATSKLEAEKYLAKKNAMILRLGTAYGVSDTYSRLRMDLVLNVMTMKALLDKKLSVFGGDQWRPVIHVKDIAHTACAALKSSQTGIFNLAQTNIRILDLAEMIKDQVGEDVEIHCTPTLFEDSRNYKADISKIKKAIGFSPYYKLSDGINDIINLATSLRVKDFNINRYSNAQYLTQHGVI